MNSINVNEEIIVSYIMMTYKRFDYIYEAIDSILTQTFKNSELVISDDNSPNFDEEKIVNYVREKKPEYLSKLVIIKNDTQLGIVKNFNKSIKNAKGKYFIQICDDDVLYEDRTTEKIVSFFESKKCLIATAMRDLYDKKMENFIERLPSEKDIKYFKKSPIELFRRLAYSNFISGASTYFSREFIEKYGYYNEDYYFLEDYPKYLEITRNNDPIEFMNFPTIKFRVGGMSTSEVLHTPYLDELSKVVTNEALSFKNEIGFFYFWLITSRFKLSGYKKKLKAFLG